MQCNFPVGTYRLDGSQAYRPCGSCIGCRLAYSRGWAIRAHHEAFLNKENCFLSLTYNNQNLPKDGSIHKSELQNFIRDLRKYAEPKKIRFFGCGEYGDKNGRPHYHACVFGLDFQDKELLHAGTISKWNKVQKKGDDHDIYISSDLQKIWQKGYHTIGKLSFESAAYVARYCTKKINGKMAKNHYGDKQPEFALMSRMPGLGREWIEKYWNDVYPKDFFTINGTKMRPPRYYDDFIKKHRPEIWKIVEERRRKKADELKMHSSIRGMQKEKYRKNITKTLERKI